MNRLLLSAILFEQQSNPKWNIEQLCFMGKGILEIIIFIKFENCSFRCKKEILKSFQLSKISVDVLLNLTTHVTHVNSALSSR